MTTVQPSLFAARSAFSQSTIAPKHPPGTTEQTVLRTTKCHASALNE